AAAKRMAEERDGRNSFGATPAPVAYAFEETQPRYVVLARRTDSVKEVKELNQQIEQLRSLQPEAKPKSAEEKEEVREAAPATTTQPASKPAAAMPSRQRALARFLLAVGLLGLIGVGFAAMLRLPVKAWAWVPAVAASLACIATGLCQLPEVCRHFG